VIEDSQLTEKIVPEVRGLMADQAKRTQMSEAMRSLNKPEASARIASLLTELAKTSQQNGVRYVPNPSD
jgi:UDP-N-acetylglucosamine:LPS N-acetylglucosamine transferase